jgi:hypothetical protein
MACCFTAGRWAGEQAVTAFVGRHVMDLWANPSRHDPERKSLFRAEYNALGMRNIETIERIARLKYRRRRDFKRQHPFVEISTADIVESGEVLNMQEFVQKSV